MQKKMLLYVLCYFGVIILPPVLFFGLMVLAGADMNAPSTMRAFGWFIAFDLAFATFMFFQLADWLLYLPPKASAVPRDLPALVAELGRVFGAAPSGTPTFDVFTDGNRMSITTAAGFAYDQLVRRGGARIKDVFLLRFDPGTRDAYILMKQKRTDWSASASGFDFSFHYQVGLSFDWTTAIVPSIVIGPDGRRSLDLQKFTYSNAAFWDAISDTVTGSGWTLRAGLLPNPWHRLALTLATLALGAALGLWMTGLITAGNSAQRPSPTAQTAEAPATPDEEAAWAEIQKETRAMNESQMRRFLEPHLAIDPKSIRGLIRRHFLLVSRRYQEQPDRDPTFARTLADFEKRL